MVGHSPNNTDWEPINFDVLPGHGEVLRRTALKSHDADSVDLVATFFVDVYLSHNPVAKNVTMWKNITVVYKASRNLPHPQHLIHLRIQKIELNVSKISYKK